MATACTYCENDVYDHDPIFVDEHEDGSRQTAGRFCNYAGLSAYIEENELTEGACCKIDL